MRASLVKVDFDCSPKVIPKYFSKVAFDEVVRMISEEDGVEVTENRLLLRGYKPEFIKALLKKAQDVRSF